MRPRERTVSSVLGECVYELWGFSASPVSHKTALIEIGSFISRPFFLCRYNSDLHSIGQTHFVASLSSGLSGHVSNATVVDYWIGSTFNHQRQKIANFLMPKIFDQQQTNIVRMCGPACIRELLHQVSWNVSIELVFALKIAFNFALTSYHF